MNERIKEVTFANVKLQESFEALQEGTFEDKNFTNSLKGLKKTCLKIH